MMKGGKRTKVWWARDGLAIIGRRSSGRLPPSSADSTSSRGTRHPKLRRPAYEVAPGPPRSASLSETPASVATLSRARPAPDGRGSAPALTAPALTPSAASRAQPPDHPGRPSGAASPLRRCGKHPLCVSLAPASLRPREQATVSSPVGARFAESGLRGFLRVVACVVRGLSGSDSALVDRTAGSCRRGWRC